MPLFTYNLYKTGNFFGSSQFWRSNCRQLVDSLNSAVLRQSLKENAGGSGDRNSRFREGKGHETGRRTANRISCAPQKLVAIY